MARLRSPLTHGTRNKNDEVLAVLVHQMSAIDKKVGQTLRALVGRRVTAIGGKGCACCDCAFPVTSRDIGCAHDVSAWVVAADERHSCLARIRRNPKPWTAASFEAVEWLPSASIDPAIADLLPRGLRALTPKEVAACNGWFGKHGRFPAVHLATGQVRGV